MVASAATLSPPRRLAVMCFFLVATLGFMTFTTYFHNSISLVSIDETLSQRQLTSEWVQRHPERGVSAWARNNFRPLSSAPGEREVVLFWHVPKSGGSTAKSIYRCMDETIVSLAQEGSLPAKKGQYQFY